MPQSVQEIQVSSVVQLLPVVYLKAGQLTCMYEHGKLRYLRSGHTEILRMIYIALRDSKWQTLPYIISNEKIVKEANSFSIQYNATYYQKTTAVYKGSIAITGKQDGTIQFSFSGEAIANFQRNRIGICVHHPIKECNGQKATITKPDNSVYEASFPVAINPHQPFTDVQQMSWQTPDKHTVQLLFTGDIFETEDQRNWSDSSFKTYSTPQNPSFPLPVSLSPGDAIAQSVTCKVQAPLLPSPIAENNFYEEKIPFPSIGYCRQQNLAALHADQINLFKKNPCGHYRVALALKDENWKQVLAQASQEAIALQTKLQLTLHFSEAYADELAAVLPTLIDHQLHIASILPLKQSATFVPAAMQSAIYNAIKEKLPMLPVGYGTDGNFVNLNRNRPALGYFDFVSFGLYPQAHSKDERSILENLDNQPDMVASANAIAGGKPVFVSPITLHDRNGAAGADKRKHTSFGHWWLLMCIQQLGMADSISLDAGNANNANGNANGTNRNANDANGSANDANQNANDTNGVNDYYQLLSAIQSFSPVWLVKRYKGDALLMDGLLLENKNGERLMIKPPAVLKEFRD
ncbi:MAG: hypothetical protein QM726_16510 [Chitinophagaceae bacterium]